MTPSSLLPHLSASPSLASTFRRCFEERLEEMRHEVLNPDGDIDYYGVPHDHPHFHQTHLLNQHHHSGSISRHVFSGSMRWTRFPNGPPPELEDVRPLQDISLYAENDDDDDLSPTAADKQVQGETHYVYPVDPADIYQGSELGERWTLGYETLASHQERQAFEDSMQCRKGKKKQFGSRQRREDVKFILKEMQALEGAVDHLEQIVPVAR
jgi:hypothetical protein